MLAVHTSRRAYLKSLTAALAFQPASASPSATSPPPGHERRIQWWRDAKFGMFVHWGVYSLLGRDAWAMGDEDIPVSEYEPLRQAVSAPAERRPRLGAPGA